MEKKKWEEDRDYRLPSQEAKSVRIIALSIWHCMRYIHRSSNKKIENETNWISLFGNGGNVGEHSSKPSALAEIPIPPEQAFFSQRRRRRWVRLFPQTHPPALSSRQLRRLSLFQVIFLTFFFHFHFALSYPFSIYHLPFQDPWNVATGIATLLRFGTPHGRQRASHLRQTPPRVLFLQSASQTHSNLRFLKRQGFSSFNLRHDARLGGSQRPHPLSSFHSPFSSPLSFIHQHVM